MKQAKIISIANHKGGVGKTTTTASVGSILATKGYKVLVIDLDAQANLTSSLIKGEASASIYDAMKNPLHFLYIELMRRLSWIWFLHPLNLLKQILKWLQK